MTMTHASPYIPVKDVEASIVFFGRALGFEARMRDGSPTNFAIIGKDEVTLTLTLDRGGHVAGKAATYITVSGVDSFYRRCLEAGAALDSDLAVRPYGMKDFCVHDLDENHIYVGESVQTR